MIDFIIQEIRGLDLAFYFLLIFFLCFFFVVYLMYSSVKNGKPYYVGAFLLPFVFSIIAMVSLYEGYIKPIPEHYDNFVFDVFEDGNVCRYFQQGEKVIRICIEDRTTYRGYGMEINGFEKISKMEVEIRRSRDDINMEN